MKKTTGRSTCKGSRPVVSVQNYSFRICCLPDEKLFPGQLQNRLQELIITVDDGELMLLIVISRGAFFQQVIRLRIPGNALLVQRLQKP